MEAEPYNQKRMASKSARKRSKKISDDDSDDAYLASQTNKSSSLSSKQPYNSHQFFFATPEFGKITSSF